MANGSGRVGSGSSRVRVGSVWPSEFRLRVGSGQAGFGSGRFDQVNFGLRVGSGQAGSGFGSIVTDFYRVTGRFGSSRVASGRLLSSLLCRILHLFWVSGRFGSGFGLPNYYLCRVSGRVGSSRVGFGLPNYYLCRVSGRVGFGRVCRVGSGFATSSCQCSSFPANIFFLKKKWKRKMGFIIKKC